MSDTVHVKITDKEFGQMFLTGKRGDGKLLIEKLKDFMVDTLRAGGIPAVIAPSQFSEFGVLSVETGTLTWTREMGEDAHMVYHWAPAEDDDEDLV